MSRSPYQLPDEIVFPDDQEDMRLDVALKHVFSALSLREIRRILNAHHLKINGQRAMKGSLVKAGDRLELIDRSPDTPLRDTPERGRVPDRSALNAPDVSGRPDDRAARVESKKCITPAEAPVWGEGPGAVHVVRQNADFVALFKPAGLHSAELKNRGGDSLEELLAATWQERFSAPPILLNRLDLLTSGLVMAAFSEDMVRQFQDWEHARQIRKTYYALVHGAATGELRLTRRLDMDSRIKTRVLDQDDPDSARHTLARPLAVFSGPELEDLAARLDLGLGLDSRPDLERMPAPEAMTLLQITIQRGARHQIRAHLAAAGHPIVGDHLYGRHPGRVMYLHHAAISLPDFEAQCPPPWPGELLGYLA